MKHSRFTLLGICCSLLLSSSVFAKGGNVQSLDGIAAVVNDTAIMQSEVNEATRSFKAQMAGANIPLPPADVIRTKVIEQIIGRKLQLQIAEQAGIKVSDNDVDQMIEKIAKGNGVTVDVLYEKVAAQDLTRAEYRKDIREELTLQQIQQQQVGSKVVMTAEDVKNFMHSKEWQKAAAAAMPDVNEYHVEDLIVLVPEASSPQDVASAKTQAQALLKQAKQGANFGALITANAKNLENNDLGWRKLNELPSAFADAIASAKKSSVIGPIQTGNGFHIVRLADMRQAKNNAAQAMPAPTGKEAEQIVYEKKFAEALKKWVAKLRSQAVINMHPESIG